MIYTDFYKDRPAVFVESDCLVAAFLMEDGGKMASLKVKNTGKELLAVKDGEKYKVLTYDGDYVSSECSGFDDMFPTVDPYTPTDGAYENITYPDHGETCRIPYALSVQDNRVVLAASSRLFPIQYKKTITTGTNGELLLHYTIENSGDTAFPCLWAGHIMLRGEDGTRVFAPFQEDTPTEMMFSSVGMDASLPKDRLIGYEPGVGAAYKFYYLSPMQTGSFGLQYADGKKLTFTVDPEKIPYLGIWFNNGEFQDLYSITPEPCTLPFDAPDRAAKHGYNFEIPAHSTFDFTLALSYQ